MPQGLGGPLLVSPMATWMILFFLAPLLLIFIYSFGYQGVYDKTVKLTLHSSPNAAGEISPPGDGIFSMQTFHNYKKVLSDRLYFKSFYKTVGMVVGNTVGCLILGYPLAYFISRKSGKRKMLFLLLLMLPFWTSFLIRTYAWLTILGSSGIPALLESVGAKDVVLLNTAPAVMLGIVYNYLPLMVFPLYVSLERMDKRLLEASKDLGAGRLATFRQVTLPLSAPGLLSGVLLVFIPIMGEYIIPAMLGGGKVFFIGNALVDLFLQSRDWPFGSAASIVLILVTLVAVSLYLWLGSRGQVRRDMSIL